MGFSTKEIFCHIAGTDLPEWNVVAQASNPRRYKAGDTLFMSGQRRSQVFVVNEGVLKLMYETPDGDSWVKGFVEAGTSFACASALQADGTTSCSAYVETDSLIDTLDFHVLMQLSARHVEWQRALTNAFMVYGQRKEQRERELLTLTPEERYVKFLQDYPRLAAVVKQRDIAGYVRVTPVALSRIKSRLMKRGLMAEAQAA